MSADTPRETTQTGGRRALGIALLLVIALFLLVAVRYAAPAPRGAEAPAGEFSAARALAPLEGIVGHGESRWPGSAAHARARQWLLTALSEYGYSPQVQSAVACSRWDTCATVGNVVARREGREGSDAVLVMAHYDSVRAGPGAGDDAAGVAAALEVARLLASAPPGRNAVIFLLTDGEEAGLLGAEAFARDHPWAGEVKAVVNLEGRGSSGPSLMFETGPGTGALLPHFARSARRPVTSSLFATIYERLPNDTDFTVFRRRGVPGFNFSFIGDGANYHTRRDSLENLSLGSLQHHGDQLLGLVGELAEADLSPASVAPPVFFDLLAWKVVWWPAGWTLPLAALALLLLLASVVLGLRGGLYCGGALGWGLLGWVGMAAAGGGLAFLAGFLLRAVGAFPPPWSPFTRHPWLWAAFLAAGLLGTSLVAALLARRAGFWGRFAGTWLVWAVLGLVLAFGLPGGSFLFLVPALAAGLVGLASALRRSEGLGRAGALVAMAAAACLWLPLLVLLDDGLGHPGLPILGVLAALFATTLAPFVGEAGGRGRWLLPAAAAAVLVLGAVLAIVAPPRVDPPGERLVLFHEDGDEARWRVPTWGRRELPLRLREARPPFGAQPAAAAPWRAEDERVFEAPANGLALPPPELTVVSETHEGSRHLVRVRLVSPRGAPEISLHLPTSLPLAGLAIAGQEVPLEAGRRWQRRGPWRSFTYLTLPAEGVEVELAADSAEPVEAYLSDESYGLPEGVNSPLPSASPSESRDPDRVSTVAVRAILLGGGSGEQPPP